MRTTARRRVARLAVTWLALACLAPTIALAQLIKPQTRTYDPGEEEEVWQEINPEPPAAPKQENLIEFYVSAASSNKYFIDGTTLSPGSDGIVRYVLVVLTSGGATNVSFEGIHCKEWRWKHYASGRADGSWIKARDPVWRPIENKPVNRHHAALKRDLFCPSGEPIRTADEGRRALRLGAHPDAR